MSTATRHRSRRDLVEALGHAGREHSEATVIFNTTVAERLALNPTDAKTMSLLQRRGPMAAGEIASRTGLSTAAVTALIDRLEQRGLARRRPDPSDRRRVLVEVTEDAEAVFAAALRSTSRSVARMWDAYSTAELEVILDFLTRNAERLRHETACLPDDAVAPRSDR